MAATRYSALRSATPSSWALAFGPARYRRHSRATAEITSIPESTPKPTRATLPTARPTPIATTASTTFQATVNHSSQRPRRWSSSLRAAVGSVDTPSGFPFGRA